jgi:hypothetical protein
MEDLESINTNPDEKQRYAVCVHTWDTHSREALNNYKKTFAKQKVSFDYDDTLSTKKGFELAMSLIEKGDTIYVISARSNKEPMLTRTNELGIPDSRVYATGSNKAKVEKVLELGIDKHYDNNADVINELGKHGILFK